MISRCVWAWLAVLGPGSVALGQDPVVEKGLQFLRGRSGTSGAGEAALMALAMVKADVPATDPALVAFITKIRARFPSSTTYTPERGGGADIYEAAVVAMALVNIDAVAYRSNIEAVANYLASKQNVNGSWDYSSRTTQGDSSITQYALLGLWEAENAGATVAANVWDRAAGWYKSVQSGQGSWNYHRDEGARYPETLSMTAAGAGSLLLCDRQLARYRKGGDSVNPMLVPVTVAGQRAFQLYDVQNAAVSLNEAARRGISWISSNFGLGRGGGAVGPTPYYFLYGVERVGALSDRDTLGSVDWYDQGRRFIQATQQADGGWNSEYGAEANSAYAILFLTRATRKTLRKFEINRLPAGTLLGGRGLPKDLSTLTVAQGRVLIRPMNGAVEGMLRVLEDPRGENADSALAGLLERYQAQGPEGLRPFKDRFRKLITDPDPGVRRVAAWAMGRTGDLDVVPLLVAALKQPKEDEAVVAEARASLQFLSRKIDGYGPDSPSTPAGRADAARRWLAWYSAIRPIDSREVDGDLQALEAPAPAGRAP